MQIKKTALADEDLIDIFIYGSQNFGQSKAKSYYTELHNAFLFLAENPLVCPERNEFEPSVRIHSHGKHLIIYTIDNTFANWHE
jgi:toxin ParE1/3/4